MKEVFRLIKKVTKHDAHTVLIRGESGTGKELIARAIHNMSKRATSAFIEIDCASMPVTLLESELFGYEKGAFTDANRSKPGLLEEADKGTIFFDEIGDMDPILQKKLLRVLEEKSFRRLGSLKKIYADFRVIAATNQHLERLVSEGRFREDLLYRLNMMPVFLPPLRDRGNDVIKLAKHFIAKFNRKYRKSVDGLSLDAESLLINYPWPGNVRELKNVLERIMIVNNVREILAQHLPEEILSAAGKNDSDIYSLKRCGVTIPKGGMDFNQFVGEITLGLKEQLISQALKKTHGNKTRAAKMLRLSRTALGRQIKKVADETGG